MAALRSTVKQGAPFSAWEAMDTLFEQAFSLRSTLSPLVSSPLDIVDHISKLPRSFGVQDPYHKSVPVPRQNDYRKDSLSSSPSSISSVSSFAEVREPRRPKTTVPASTTVKASQPVKTLKVQLAPTPTSPPLPSPTKNRPRTSRVRYCESTGATQSAIFSLPRVVNGDVHIGFTHGQLEIKWEYTKSKKLIEGGKIVIKQKPKRFAKVLPLAPGTQFSQIRANLNGRQLTVTYPKSK